MRRSAMSALVVVVAACGGTSDSNSTPPRAGADEAGAGVPNGAAAASAPAIHSATSSTGVGALSQPEPPAPPATPNPAEERGATSSVRIPAQGISEKLSARYSQHDSVSTWAVCTLGDRGATGAFSLAVGNARGSGRVQLVELHATEDITVPGIAKGRGTVRTSTDAAVSGTITFNSDKASGTFEMNDSAGAPVTGSFNCNANL